MTENRKKISDALAFLYGCELADSLTDQLWQKIEQFKASNPQVFRHDPAHRVDEKDVIMIAYADMVQDIGEKPLETLHRFAAQALTEMVNTIHILPFFPYSSDDGFSVIDYKQVKPEWGSWEDVAVIAKDFSLMFDVVVNHISQYSAWFQGFLAQRVPYQDYFITVDPAVDLSAVFRPRALPLLTEFDTASGKKFVWTTFSADQIDLNFSNPDVLIAVLDVFLFYIANGARFIRLDAVAFIWKEIGTNCLHLPQVHKIIELTRSVLDETAPQVVLITETNVPHQENISYFGDGKHEAQMVYNFSLPPLVLHSIQTGSAAALKHWASTLDLPTEEVTFFNFLASHDGVGLLPARGILSADEFDALAEHTLKMGGRVSYKNNPDGSKSPYEMNINYLDATRPNLNAEPVELTAKRFLATQSILLMMRGVPGIYYHSLLGSQNWAEGMLETGQNRSINREKLNLSSLLKELESPNMLRYHVFKGYKTLLKIRRREKAFDPHGEQVILDTPECVFGVFRRARRADRGIICLTNLSPEACDVVIQIDDLEEAEINQYCDLLSGETVHVNHHEVYLTMASYQTIWLKDSENLPSFP